MGWTARKYEWATKREYNNRRNQQIDLATAVNQSLSDILGSMGGSKERQDLILPELEEALRLQNNEPINDGVDHTQWWTPQND